MYSSCPVPSPTSTPHGSLARARRVCMLSPVKARSADVDTSDGPSDSPSSPEHSAPRSPRSIPRAAIAARLVGAFRAHARNRATIPGPPGRPSPLEHSAAVWAHDIFGPAQPIFVLEGLGARSCDDEDTGSGRQESLSSPGYSAADLPDEALGGTSRARHVLGLHARSGINTTVTELPSCDRSSKPDVAVRPDETPFAARQRHVLNALRTQSGLEYIVAGPRPTSSTSAGSSSASGPASSPDTSRASSKSPIKWPATTFVPGALAHSPVTPPRERKRDGLRWPARVFVPGSPTHDVSDRPTSSSAARRPADAIRELSASGAKNIEIGLVNTHYSVHRAERRIKREQEVQTRRLAQTVRRQHAQTEMAVESESECIGAGCGTHVDESHAGRGRRQKTRRGRRSRSKAKQRKWAANAAVERDFPAHVENVTRWLGGMLEVVMAPISPGLRRGH